MKILKTTNFSFEEFLPRSNPNWQPNTLQVVMLNMLMKSLQVVRDTVGQCIDVSNSVRLVEDYNRLLANGYKPSLTSDHFFGEPIRVPSKHPRRPLYGEYYSFSAGAADVVCAVGAEELYHVIITLQRKGSLPNLGQVLLETQNGDSWIHVANSLTCVVKQAGESGVLSNTKFSPMRLMV